MILFVHGLGGSSQNFEPIISKAKLEESHRVASFDLRGHGLSSLGSTDKLVFEDYVGSIGAVLDWARADKAVIVAHSMGGLVATTFAARSPERVTHLGKLCNEDIGDICRLTNIDESTHRRSQSFS